ncbi:hypothetical protein [Sulfuricurvum sp.]|uniref:hypothetical protein n=1 Tax=Sulfuricurvum sp. TaxID=2025608 RepID=UPI002627CD10|nr:hypothetical protein [Sulfuricurvum sp.]MDD2267053.1 hypothetical protein [Sulfuricurvum sp.]
MQISQEFISQLKELNNCFSSSQSACKSEFLNNDFMSIFCQMDQKQRLELLQNLLENKKSPTNDISNQTNFINTCLENENTRQVIIFILWQMLLVDVKNHFTQNFVNHDSFPNVAKYTSIDVSSVIKRATEDDLHKHSLEYLLFTSLKNFILFDTSCFEISPALLDLKFNWESLDNDNNKELLIIQEMIDNSFDYLIAYIRDEFKEQIINLDFFQYYLHKKSKNENNRFTFLGVIADQMDELVKEIRNSANKYDKIKNMLMLLASDQQLLKATVNKKVIFPQLVFVLAYIFAEKVVYGIFRSMSSSNNILADLKKQFDNDLIAFEMISSYFLDMSPNISELKKKIQQKYDYYVKIEKFNFTSDWDLFEKMIKEYQENSEKDSKEKGQQSLNLQIE